MGGSARNGVALAVAVGAVLWGVGALALGARSGGAEDGGPGTVADTVQDVRLVETTEVTPGTDGVVDGQATQGDGVATARATFAGGCFWCMEPPFDELEGVRATVSGFAGGHREDPTYREVSSGGTGHREVVQVTYDPRRVSYTRLLEVYWHNVDPRDGGGQFCDRGHQYSPAIFHHNDEQEQLARASLQRLEASGELKGGVAVEVLPLDAFYPAEAYHQDFYRKNPGRYHSYREGCGRDRVLRAVWGDAAGH